MFLMHWIHHSEEWCDYMTGFKCSDDIFRAESIHFWVHFIGVAFIQRQHHPLQRKSFTTSFTPIIYHFSNSLRKASGASQVAQTVKNPPATQETWVPSLSWEEPLEESMPTRVFLPGESPWTEESSGLHVGLQRTGHDWVAKHKGRTTIS